uniref:SH3 domain-containing protein n=1 Tax=Acetatifactor sp. TaxID=1872090 RepID=UPI00405612B0
MWKDKLGSVINFIVKHSKIVFPVIVIAGVALTVSVSLNASNSDKIEELTQDFSTTVESTVEETVVPEGEEEIPMVLNEDPAILTLIATFYNAVALGDADTMNSVCDEISLKDMLRYEETAKYIETYPALDIYTKPGPEEGSTIAFIYYKVVFAGHEDQFPGYTAHYICTDEQGQLYIKNGENSEEVNQYIGEVMAQDDVVEFHNRVTVEYNDLMDAKPELLQYLNEMNNQVSIAVGTALADIKAAETPSEETAENTDGQTAEGEETVEGTEQAPAEQPAENVIQYATATTTVNVRSSDSEQADKLGKVSGGTRLQILEQKLNGWTKVLYDGKDGFIKSEFLEVVESADGLQSMGTVTATTNINVRASGSETADKLGVLIGGETVELYANENGWCKINYNGQVGYVKADYVQ